MKLWVLGDSSLRRDSMGLPCYFWAEEDEVERCRGVAIETWSSGGGSVISFNPSPVYTTPDVMEFLSDHPWFSWDKIGALDQAVVEAGERDKRNGVH